MKIESPEKIWIDMDDFTFAFQPLDDSDVPYIRADIVDELLKALIAIGAGQGDPKELAIQTLENYIE